MTKKDSAIDSFYALKPYNYVAFASLQLSRDAGQEAKDSFNLVLRLASKTGSAADARFLIAEFKGVRDLHIGELDRVSQRHLLVDVSSIKEDQLENLNYHVVENEENAFSFKCREFTAKVGNN